MTINASTTKPIVLIYVHYNVCIVGKNKNVNEPKNNPFKVDDVIVNG